jgi:hypothetical protein
MNAKKQQREKQNEYNSKNKKQILQHQKTLQKQMIKNFLLHQKF